MSASAITTEVSKAPARISTSSHTLLNKLTAGVGWILKRVKVQQARKSLRLCENLSLGEKRFVAVIQVDEQRFLIGGASGSVSLLTRLSEPKTFTEALLQVQKEDSAS
jgi:flagellar biogenesis protein FliO